MGNFKKNIYHTEQFLTGLAGLGLPLVHTIETFLLTEIVSQKSNLFCNIIISLIVFGPSVFMLFMGFNLSSEKSPKALFNRGLIFLILGFLLNILRSIIPIILVSVVIDTTFDYIFSFLILSDIYYFVGLFFMLFALFVKLKLSASVMFIVSLLMLIINFFLSGLFKTNSETINAFIGNFIYVDDGSIFPLFSWSVFPIFGFLIKNILNNKDDKKASKIMLISLIVSLILFATAVIILSVFKYDVIKIMVSPLNDYITDFLNVALLLLFNTLIICTLFFVINKFSNSKLFGSISWLSKNIVPFYIIQWIIVTLFCYSIAVYYTLTETFIPIYVMFAVAVINIILSILITKKFGYRILKFMLKISTFNNRLK